MWEQEQPKCMWEQDNQDVCGSNTTKMYMGARKQKCMWVQDNRDVCGSKTTNMYVGAGTTKMSKQDKHKSAKITYA